MPDGKLEDEMSERDKQFAESVAQAVMARFLHALQSDEISSKVMDNWGGQIDRVIGRALRRLGGYVLMALIGIGAMKLGLLEKLGQFVKG